MGYLKIPNETDKEFARRALEENETYAIKGWFDAKYFSGLSENGKLRDQTFDGLFLNFVHFQQANFTGSSIRSSRFHNVMFNQSLFARCVLSNIQFINCDLSHTIWTDAVFQDVEMRNCRLAGLNLKRLKAAGVKVAGQDFDGPTDDDEE